ncbi:hypothetical protein [Sphingomonas sp. Leaf21]|uniref:hypothetical protein n=1 Tax=Sphingomonas sp. Leaf21 TaxID=2876550 RepID=UPI001E3ED8C9|nr:hypothetical protein [Sphingomonas sp. Leaf21]
MLIVAWALLQAQTVPPPQQTPPPPPPPPMHGGMVPMTCPIGGERFSGWQAGSYSTYGERPDGRPYSYLHFPFPVPECPGNHLVVFDNFPDADKAALAMLIATPAYARLVAEGDTPYYRASWLSARLSRPEPVSLGWLQAALWADTPGFIDPLDSTEAGKRRARYASEFVDRVRRLPSDTSMKDRLWLTARAANQLRQMGDFAAAETMRHDAMAMLGQPGVGDGWDDYLAKLGPVIARRDASVEPLDMIPVREAAYRCAKPGKTPLSAMETRLCAKPTIAAEAAKVAK